MPAVFALSVVEEITNAGGHATAFAGDVGDEADMIALFEHAESAFGGVDVVVNTAGIMPLSTVAETELEVLTLIPARELRGRDVTVNAVAPGPTATPLFLDGKSRELVDHIASLAPLERLGTPEDIAETVAFLAGPARWVNGQVLYTNGGVA